MVKLIKIIILLANISILIIACDSKEEAWSKNVNNKAFLNTESRGVILFIGNKLITLSADEQTLISSLGSLLSLATSLEEVKNSNHAVYSWNLLFVKMYTEVKYKNNSIELIMTNEDGSRESEIYRYSKEKTEEYKEVFEYFNNNEKNNE